MAYKVCVVTGTRADYGLLRELLFRLKSNPLINLIILVTGSHLSEKFGNTQQEIPAQILYHFFFIVIFLQCYFTENYLQNIFHKVCLSF